MEVVDRLFDFMASRNISQNKFEEMCGLTHSNLRGMKQGPTAAYLVKITSAFPDLSMDWLIRGTGSMTLGESSQQHPSTITPSVRVDNVQAVFITNWNDIQTVVENAVNKAMKKH